MIDFFNVYEDRNRAEAYAKLEFPGTYYLAFRDIPAILTEHSRGKVALDFGCGAGRSTRFLRQLGFQTIGVDISAQMIAQAKTMDPEGDYRLVPGDDLTQFAPGTFDVIQAAFTFDNVPTMETKVALFRDLNRLLKKDGCILNLVSSPDIYLHEWASFSTKNYPENKKVPSGGKVLIVMLDVEDRRPVEDIVWSDEDYGEVYRRAGLAIARAYRPLGKPDEPYSWVSETTVAPWVIYVLNKAL